MASSELATVSLWHRLLNDGEIEQLIALIDPDVEVGGPRGSGHGAALFRQWFGRAGVRLTPLRYFHRKSVVVVEQEGEWQPPTSDQPAGRQRLATVFTLSGGSITRIVRFPALLDALEAAGVTDAEEAPGAG
ncbi:MAG TPA: nuclear transport factor 2 family protein [Chloroflexota bacterium]|nr:nuclear transport factor 2 family protein [Chloroflexota bacterium]